jgi:hypothetical protein
MSLASTYQKSKLVFNPALSQQLIRRVAPGATLPLRGRRVAARGSRPLPAHQWAAAKSQNRAIGQRSDVKLPRRLRLRPANGSFSPTPPPSPPRHFRPLPWRAAAAPDGAFQTLGSKRRFLRRDCM